MYVLDEYHILPGEEDTEPRAAAVAVKRYPALLDNLIPHEEPNPLEETFLSSFYDLLMETLRDRQCEFPLTACHLIVMMFCASEALPLTSVIGC